MNGTLRRFVPACAMGVLTVLLLVPADAAAQRATGTLIVRVEEGGAPAPGVDVGVFTRRTGRTLATTGSTGLAAVEQLTVDAGVGTRMFVHVLRCPSRTTVYLVPETERIDSVPPGCEDLAAGLFFWGQTERIVVRVDGDRAVVEATQAETLTERLSGLRFTADFLFTTLSGFDLGSGESEFGSGIGGQARLFHLWPSGLGLGAGGSLTFHDVTGSGANMNKWSAFVEPRYTFLFGSSKIRPHVLARASYNWFSYDSGASSPDQKGFGFGGGVGAHYPLLGWLGAEVGIYYGYLSMDYSGFDESRSGSELQLTGGLRFF